MHTSVYVCMGESSFNKNNSRLRVMESRLVVMVLRLAVNREVIRSLLLSGGCVEDEQQKKKITAGKADADDAAAAAESAAMNVASASPS